jgi:hypothetical protein
MRTSNKILVIVAAVLAASVVASIVVSRLLVDRVVQIEENGKAPQTPGDYVTQELEARGFDELRITGGWKVRVRQGEEYRVVLSMPENYRSLLEAERRGSTLHLGLSRGLDMRGTHIEAQIVMPKLTGVRSVGGIHLELAGFSGERLVLQSSGGSNIEAQGGPYERIVIELQGGSNVNLLELPAENVHVDAVGASNVRLHLQGGALTGSISGAGSVKYRGEVSSQSVSSEGVTSVRRID